MFQPVDAVDHILYEHEWETGSYLSYPKLSNTVA